MADANTGAYPKDARIENYQIVIINPHKATDPGARIHIKTKNNAKAYDIGFSLDSDENRFMFNKTIALLRKHVKSGTAYYDDNSRSIYTSFVK